MFNIRMNLEMLEKADASGALVIQRVISQLPPTDATSTLTGAIEAAKFAATAAEILPNPIAAGALTVAVVAAVAAAAEVEKEAEKQASTTKTATATSTSSSATSGPSAFLVALDQKWPDLIVDAFVHAFPDNGDGTLEEFQGLGLKTYLTNISSSLADAVSILPVFDFVVINAVPNDDNDDNDVVVGQPARLNRRDSQPG